MAPEARKKKLLYHSRRGMRELDNMLLPFVDTQFETLSVEQLELFEAFLEESDPMLFCWLMQREPAEQKYADLVALILAHARA